MSTRRSHMLWIVGAAAIAIGGYAWLRPSPLEVEVTTASDGPLRVTLDQTAKTRVRHHVEIAAPVTGRLAEIAFDVGDTVRRGEVLARLSPAPLDPRARAEAEAMLAQATARAAEARAQLQQAEVALGEARRDDARTLRLATAGAIPTRDRERSGAELRVRLQDSVAAAARLAAAQDGIRASRASLMGADATRGGRGVPVPLVSPIAGRILRIFESHDRVVAAGTPLVEVGDPSQLEIVVDVLSRDASRIAIGMPMEVRRAGQATPVRAHVERVEPAAFTARSALGVDEQRVNVIGRFDAPTTGLGDAFEVDVSIVVWERPRVLRVPAAALVPLDSGWSVYAVRDGRAAQRPVGIGARGARDAEVTGGLAAGDSIVLRPDERLRNGGRVQPMR